MLNPNYDEEVEEYLKNYRRHLERGHENGSLRGTVRWITPVFENQGSRPASNVRIEFEMPKDFVNPTNDMILRALLATRPPDSYLTPPREPELVRNIEDLMGMGDNLSWLTMPLDPGGPALVEPSDPNAIEMEYLDSGGAISIVYNIPRLIQRRPTKGPKFLLWLREFAESATWRISVRVDAEEFPEMVEQALYIDTELA